MLRFDTFAQALCAAEAGAGILLGSLPLCRAALEAVVSGERAPAALCRELSLSVAAHGRAATREKLGAVRTRARALAADPQCISELESELSRLERYDG